MAEEENKDSGQEKEENIEFKCTACGLEDNVTRATRKCVECDVLMCDSCFEDHKKLRYLRSHQILDEDEMRSQIQDAGVSSPAPKRQCWQHPDKVVDLYCEEHDQACCSACVAIHHRRCDEIKYIATMIESPDSKSGDLKETIARAKDLRAVLTKRREGIGEDVESLNKEKDEMMKTLEREEQKAAEEVKTRFEKAREEVEKRFTKTRADFEDLTNDIDKRILRLDNTLDRLYKTSEENASDRFVDLKEGEEVLKVIGELQGGDKTQNKPGLAVSVSELGVRPDDDSWPLVEEKERTLLIRSLKSVMQWKVGKDCCVMELSDGRLLVSSFRYKTLALHDSSLKFICEIDLEDNPQAFCQVGKNEIAVSFRDKNVIQHYTVGASFEAGECFTILGTCCGLYYETDEDNLYATISGDLSRDASSSLNVYNKRGDFKRSIVCKDSDGDSVLSEPREIQMDKNKTIYVTDYWKGLIAMDKQGTLLWEYVGMASVKKVHGLGVIDTGNVIVAGDRAVVQITNKGKNVKILPVTEDPEEDIPTLSVCYIKRNNLLILGAGGPYIDIFSLETQTI